MPQCPIPAEQTQTVDPAPVVEHLGGHSLAGGRITDIGGMAIASGPTSFIADFRPAASRSHKDDPRARRAERAARSPALFPCWRR